MENLNHSQYLHRIGPLSCVAPNGVHVQEYSGGPRRAALPASSNVVLVYSLAYRGRWGLTWGGHSRSTIVAAGQLFVVPAGVETCWELGTPHHCVFVHLPPGQISAAAADLGLDQEQTRCRETHQVFDPAVGNLIRSLLEELQDASLGSAVAAEALTRLLTMQLLRRYRAEDACEHRAYLAPARLQAALEFVEGHLGAKISTSKLSRASQLSPYHFARLFKLAVGQTPHQYVLSRRIDRAKVLLADLDRPLVDIALDVGFPNQSYFGTVFRKLTGQTPRQFRDTLSASGVSPIRHAAPLPVPAPERIAV